MSQKECSHCGDEYQWPREDDPNEEYGSDMDLCQHCEENEWNFYCDVCKEHQVGDYPCRHGFQSENTEEWEGPGVSHGEDRPEYPGRRFLNDMLDKFPALATQLHQELAAGKEPNPSVYGDMFDDWGMSWWMGSGDSLKDWGEVIWPEIVAYRKNRSEKEPEWADGIRWLHSLDKKAPEYIAEAAGMVAEWMELHPQPEPA